MRHPLADRNLITRTGKSRYHANDPGLDGNSPTGRVANVVPRTGASVVNQMKWMCEMGRLIQIANLPVSIDSLVLQRLFELHGAVRSAMIAQHLEKECGTGVGFIEMESEESGWEAILALNHREHFGKVLLVCWSENSNDWFADRPRTFDPVNMMIDGMAINETDRQQEN